MSLVFKIIFKCMLDLISESFSIIFMYVVKFLSLMFFTLLIRLTVAARDLLI